MRSCFSLPRRGCACRRSAAFQPGLAPCLHPARQPALDQHCTRWVGRRVSKRDWTGRTTCSRQPTRKTPAQGTHSRFALGCKTLHAHRNSTLHSGCPGKAATSKAQLECSQGWSPPQAPPGRLRPALTLTNERIRRAYRAHSRAGPRRTLCVQWAPVVDGAVDWTLGSNHAQKKTMQPRHAMLQTHRLGCVYESVSWVGEEKDEGGNAVCVCEDERGCIAHVRLYVHPLPIYYLLPGISCCKVGALRMQPLTGAAVGRVVDPGHRLLPSQKAQHRARSGRPAMAAAQGTRVLQGASELARYRVGWK